jgi:hypothetical protein
MLVLIIGLCELCCCRLCKILSRPMEGGFFDQVVDLMG